MGRQGKRTPLPVWTAIGEYAARHPDATAPDVQTYLEGQRELAPLTPSLVTIRMILKRLKDETPAWQLTKAEDVDSAMLLPLIGELIAESKGAVRSVSMTEAKWITAIRRAVPDVPALWAFSMARHYMVAEAQGTLTHGHDRFLAMRLWQRPKGERIMAALRGLAPMLARSLPPDEPSLEDVEVQAFAPQVLVEPSGTRKPSRTHTRTHEPTDS